MKHLVAIAKEMRGRLVKVQNGALSRVLFGGLIIVYERRAEQWRLAVGRVGAPPSKTETEVVGAAFAVPTGVEWSWTRRQRNARKPVYLVAECEWIERGAYGQEETGGSA